MFPALGQILGILLFSVLGQIFGVQEINLTFVGDAMQHGPQIRAALQSDGTYDYSTCFQHVESDIADADYAIANLECPLAGKPYAGFPNFSAPDEYARHLKDVGFDFIVTANNHCLDRRDAGLKRTITKLDQLGLPHVGTYMNAAARDTLNPQIVTIKGIRMAMLSYTYDTNGIGIQGKVVVDYINRNQIEKDIAKARQMGADLICVCMHWGIEYRLLPVDSQKSLANFLVDQGVDLIIGSHPHVIEPMEIRHSSKWNKDVLLVYSLGNFISNQNGADSRGGAMVKVKLHVNTLGEVSISHAGYKLFFCQKPARRGDNYLLIPYGKADLVRPDSKDAFNRFMTKAHAIFNAHNVNVPELEY